MEYSSIPSNIDAFISHKSDVYASGKRLPLDSKQHTLSVNFTDIDGSPKEISHQFIILGASLALSNESTILAREKTKLFDKIIFYLKSKNAKLEINNSQIIAVKE